MPNVTAMASAPPTTRRVTATTLRDRATDALSNPVIRSPMSTATNATAIRADSGGTRMAMSGSSADREGQRRRAGRDPGIHEIVLIDAELDVEVGTQRDHLR